MARRLFVRELRISEGVAEKLRDDDHQMDPDAVRAKIEDVHGLDFSWKYDEPRGFRVYVWTTIDDHSVLVVLYPATDIYRYPDETSTVWNLGTAYWVPQRGGGQ